MRAELATQTEGLDQETSITVVDQLAAYMEAAAAAEQRREREQVIERGKTIGRHR